MKAEFSKKYRLGLDEAALIEHSGKKDGWFIIVLCKHGEIYPYSDKLLAFHCVGEKMRGILRRAFPKVIVQNWSDDGEAIFLFPLSMFKEIAKYAKPKRKRVYTTEQRQALAQKMEAVRSIKTKNTDKTRARTTLSVRSRGNQ